MATKAKSKAKGAVLGILLELTLDCPRCMRPVPITAVQSKTRCRTCLHDIDLVETVFENMAPSYVAGAIRGNQSRSVDFGTVALVSRTRVAKPTCSGCGKALDVAALVAKPEAHVCACGTTTPVRQADDLAKLLEPYVKVVVGERPPLPIERCEPVAFSCPRCQHSLETNGTARALECAGCNAFVDVPERLWNALHPVTPRRDVFLLLAKGAS